MPSFARAWHASVRQGTHPHELVAHGIAPADLLKACMLYLPSCAAPHIPIVSEENRQVAYETRKVRRSIALRKAVLCFSRPQTEGWPC